MRAETCLGVKGGAGQGVFAGGLTKKATLKVRSQRQAVKRAQIHKPAGVTGSPPPSNPARRPARTPNAAPQTG
jgi:hypothetical protein